MFDRWRRKIRSLFFPEEKEMKKIHTHQKMNVKIKYQYPNHQRFRFPVIPDQEIEVPAYQRRAQENRHHKDYLIDQRNSQQPFKKNVTNHLKEPFKPSQVASPIFGYQPRDSKRDIDKVPAYVRKRETQSDENNSLKEDQLIKSENIITPQKMNRNNDCSEKDHHDQKRIQEEKSNEGKLKKGQKNVHQKGTKNSATNKLRHKRQSSSKSKSVPFNVIMTPRDKKLLREKKNRSPEIVKKPKTSIGSTQTKNYNLPIHLLNHPKKSSHEDKLWIRKQQELLEKTFKHFNVSAKVVNSTQGPTVTRFEVQPELGVKVSRVRNLSDDIKLNMAAKDIRIEAPIPGKHTIGIEVPNLKAQTVGLQEIFQTNLFKQSSSLLTVGLGLDVEGLPMITDISKMPHGLIAGATGSGKSVCINAILISLLYKASYKDVRLLLIDPKMVELAPYNGIPHLISPVITDMKAATAALKWAVNEMEERYEKFARAGVRSIEKYNELKMKQERNKDKMPFIVIIIDELADLMMVSPQEVEDAICKLAQKARACGIHLLLATQRPSVDVITGLIKANIPTRIAFSVSSQVDSRTIIDANGAERLLGKGDMLFVENGTGKSVRLQGALVSDEEIERVTNFVREISSPNYLFEQDQLLKKIESIESKDEILDDVINFVIEQTNVSTSMLQRRFRIGYNRAARLIDMLEDKGIISGQNGSKPREVLLSKDQMKELVMKQ